MANKSSATLEKYLAMSVFSYTGEVIFNAEGLMDVAPFILTGTGYSDDGRELAKKLLTSVERVDSHQLV